MTDGKEVKLRTKPPRNCQYLTWCNDCDEAVPHEEGSCAGCESLDLVYFVKESDHLAAMAELRAEVERQREAYEDTLENHVGMQIRLAAQETTIATQARVIEKLKLAITDIVNKNTCWPLYEIDKYKSYEDGWEGVAEFAREVLNELAAIEKEGAKDE